MSAYSDWIRWEARCIHRPGFGATAGDTIHSGLGDYNSLRPCPNGLPIDTREPGETEWWRERVARAKRDIEAHQRQVAFEALTEDSTPLRLSDIEQILQIEKEVCSG